MGRRGGKETYPYKPFFKRQASDKEGEISYFYASNTMLTGKQAAV